jgi:MFS family permease
MGADGKHSPNPRTQHAHPATEARPLWGTTRLHTILLLCVCNVICYADRVNIGVAIIPMALELDMDKTMETLVLSSFFWGYLVTQTMAGALCRKYGASNVLIGAVMVWSVMTVHSPVLPPPPSPQNVPPHVPPRSVHLVFTLVVLL